MLECALQRVGRLERQEHLNGAGEIPSYEINEDITVRNGFMNFPECYTHGLDCEVGVKSSHKLWMSKPTLFVERNTRTTKLARSSWIRF
jgi:hypothetical protein